MESDEQALQMLFRVLRLTRWAGIAPYRSLRPPRVCRAFELYRRIFSVFFGGAIFIALILSVQRKQAVVTNRRHVAIWLRGCIQFICILGTIYIGMFNAASRMQITFEYLRSLKKICRSIGSALSTAPEQQKLYASFLGIQFSVVLFYLFDFSIWLRKSDNIPKDAFMFTFNASELLFSDMVIIQFVMVGLTINLLFRAINDQLKSVLDKTLSSVKCTATKIYGTPTIDACCNSVLKIPVSSINIAIEMLGEVVVDEASDLQLPYQKVRSLANAYVATCRVVQQHNDADKALLALLLINTVNNLMNSFFYLLEGNIVETVVAVGVMGSILHICRIVLLVTPSHAMNMEIERTHKLIRMLMNVVRISCDPLLPELETFQLHLTMNKPSYTAMGLYTLNRSLVLAVLAICITYVSVFREF